MILRQRLLQSHIQFTDEGWKPTCQAPSENISIHLTETPERGAREASKTTNNSAHGMAKTSEWCHSFIPVHKVNGKVRFYLDPARLKKALMRLVHRGPTLNDILLRLPDKKYLTLIDTSSDYQNLKLEKESSYLTNSPCPFGRYRYTRLPCRAALSGDKFQKKR